MVGQQGQGHGVALAEEPCGLAGHFHLGHQVVNHSNIGLELDSHTTNVVLLVDQLGLVEDVLELVTEQLVTS